MLIEFDVVNKETGAEFHVELDYFFNPDEILEEIGCIDEDGNEIGSGYVIENIEADFEIKEGYFDGWDLDDFYSLYDDHLWDWENNYDEDLFYALAEVFDGDLDEFLDCPNDYFLMDGFKNWEHLGRYLFEEDVLMRDMDVHFVDVVKRALNFEEYAQNRFEGYSTTEFTSYGFVYGY